MGRVMSSLYAVFFWFCLIYFIYVAIFNDAVKYYLNVVVHNFRSLFLRITFYFSLIYCDICKC